MKALFLISKLEDVDRPKAPSIFPTLQWKVVSYEDTLVLNQDKVTEKTNDEKIDTSFTVSVSNLGGLVMLVSADDIRTSSKFPLSASVYELKNSFYQLLFRDPYTKDLPCCIYILVKADTDTQDSGAIFGSLVEKLDYSHFLPQNWKSTINQKGQMQLKEKVRLELVLESEIYPGSPLFRELEIRAFQHYQSKAH
jgi:hypothetical protein